jgi:hypothetical protein
LDSGSFSRGFELVTPASWRLERRHPAASSFVPPPSLLGAEFKLPLASANGWDSNKISGFSRIPWAKAHLNLNYRIRQLKLTAI